ncbi:MAG: 2OG-Fe(II) oxygenase [Verrucomicrobia bacterium]|nr:2OG-Fe(II) oxygenase [bacterium]NDA10641.1 2OG-Fe(II) oxygenase [Verrucomicrobiota bacterium]NDA26737.1 2OG-Fe(II) oxygenase [Verrucomicrobiota bacterium]NDD57137.1 2OG-Fe(II) oxygenase [Verrucomicrobiota bacterium]NDD82008.1 2OG-Fe(II) oxygenase [Verrucomicrobiota bacterium]
MFHSSDPFDHWIIDDFLPIDVARGLEEEFPAFDDPMWFDYSSPWQVKRTCNHWDRFPALTYSVMERLLTVGPFVELPFEVVPDIGLHGAGWHVHGRGGKLDVHQDYSIHPKSGHQRRVNLILHLTEEWEEQWGGGLELWSHNKETNKPDKLVTTIPFRFNRAVIFRTDQQSWHGLPTPLTCPEGKLRKTLAVYYVSNPEDTAASNKRAVFVPTLPLGRQVA